LVFRKKSLRCRQREVNLSLRCSAFELGRFGDVAASAVEALFRRGSCCSRGFVPDTGVVVTAIVGGSGGFEIEKFATGGQGYKTFFDFVADAK
jgi:hypothetical protein